MAFKGRCPPHSIRARPIPDDKNGALAIIRKVAGVLCVEPSSRITEAVSIKDVATAVATLPEVQAKVANPST
jgi:hypothetical protein